MKYSDRLNSAWKKKGKGLRIRKRSLRKEKKIASQDGKSSKRRTNT